MRYFFRMLMYCIGLLFMAIGVTFSVKSNLGVSPVNSIPYVISIISGLDQGICVTFIFFIYVIIQMFILKKEFNKIDLLQIICASLFGYFVSFSNMVFSFTPSEDYSIRMIYMIISIILVGIGVFLYLEARLIPLPAEGVMLALKKKTIFEFHKIKIGFDLSTVIIAIILSYIFLKNIYGVREGTILAALFVGKIVQLISKLLKKQIEALQIYLHSIEEK